MSIEGGPGKFGFEFTPEQLSDIFSGQDNSRPVVFEPRPQTLLELKSVDKHTFRVVLAAQLLLALDDESHNTDLALVGGLACACHITDGQPYRAHHDIDVMVSSDNINSVLQFWTAIASKNTTSPIRVARNIYRVSFSRVNVDLDFFVYESNQYRKAIFSGGSYPDIELQTNYPIQPEVLPLMGQPTPVVPIEVVEAMKKHDADVRAKGRLDFEMLQDRF